MMIESVVSPLTGSSNVTLIEKLSTQRLIQDWHGAFSIDTSNEFSEFDEISVYLCEDTQLIFYYPFELAGSETLYSQLSKFDWYYMPRKWEHDVAIQDLEGCKKVLEVGCGQGAFVHRLIQEHSIAAVGIEFNKKAVQIAQNHDIPVSASTLKELAVDKTKFFDAICAFQVLEHVSAPRSFLEETIQLIKPGGKLIISVPNSHCFTRHAHNNLLDQPPHHMHRWCKDTFLALQKILPLDLVRFRIEPLATYHIGWYLGIQRSRLPNIRIIRSPAFRLSDYVLKPLLERSSLFRRLIIGHTLYVEFRVRH
jgi:SAM-dependent methyltransferase